MILLTTDAKVEDGRRWVVRVAIVIGSGVASAATEVAVVQLGGELEEVSSDFVSCLIGVVASSEQEAQSRAMEFASRVLEDAARRVPGDHPPVGVNINVAIVEV